MHRIDGLDHVANLFSDVAPATVITDDWLNAVQEELALLLEGMGVALVKGTNNQLRSALVDGAGVTVTPGTNWTQVSGWARKIGKLVTLGGTFQASAGATTAFASLPSGARPPPGGTVVIGKYFDASAATYHVCTIFISQVSGGITISDLDNGTSLVPPTVQTGDLIDFQTTFYAP